MGVMAAGIFAGQMVNVRLLGVQASGHLIGGVLAAACWGRPWRGGHHGRAVRAVLLYSAMAASRP